MEKKVIVNTTTGPRRAGKTNWTRLRENMHKPPIIDDEAPELISIPGVVIKKPSQK